MRTLFNESKSKTSHYDEYRVNNSADDVFLSIYPGATGQSAVSDIFLEADPPKKGIAGTIEDHKLGSNKSLNGRELEVYTAITDREGPPDLVSFDFRLKGGPDAYKYKMERTVTSQGDTVVFKITIFFFK